MKLHRLNDEDIVTIWHGNGRYAVAEARELKAVGLERLDVRGGFLGEWTLRVDSLREFLPLKNLIPSEVRTRRRKDG